MIQHSSGAGFASLRLGLPPTQPTVLDAGTGTSNRSPARTLPTRFRIDGRFFLEAGEQQLLTRHQTRPLCSPHLPCCSPRTFSRQSNPLQQQTTINITPSVFCQPEHRTLATGPSHCYMHVICFPPHPRQFGCLGYDPVSVLLISSVIASRFLVVASTHDAYLPTACHSQKNLGAIPAAWMIPRTLT